MELTDKEIREHFRRRLRARDVEINDLEAENEKLKAAIADLKYQVKTNHEMFDDIWGIFGYQSDYEYHGQIYQHVSVLHRQYKESQAENKKLKQRIAELEAFMADALPFMKEAWDACFHGQKEKLLSAEERGMGNLMREFQKIVDGKPPTPLGMITTEEHSEILNAAIGADTNRSDRARKICDSRKIGVLGEDIFDIVMDYVEKLEAEIAEKHK